MSKSIDYKFKIREKSDYINNPCSVIEERKQFVKATISFSGQHTRQALICSWRR